MNKRVSEWLPGVDGWWQPFLLGVCCVWSPDEEGQLAQPAWHLPPEGGPCRVQTGLAGACPRTSSRGNGNGGSNLAKLSPDGQASVRAGSQVLGLCCPSPHSARPCESASGCECGLCLAVWAWGEWGRSEGLRELCRR